MVTAVTLDALSYLVAQAIKYRLRAKRTLEGEIVMGENFKEFYVDEKALYELILEEVQYRI